MNMNFLERHGLNKYIEYFIFIALFLVPFQYLGFGFDTSSKNYDVTFFIIYLVLFFLFLNKIKYNYIFFIIIFYFVQLFLFLGFFYFDNLVIPHYMHYHEYKLFPKFLISFFTINLYFLILFYRKDFKLNYNILLYVFLTTLIISIFYLYYQYFINNFSNNIRYQSTFNEPTYAGIFFYSSFLSICVLIFYEKIYYKKLIYIVLNLLVLYSAFLTKSLHMISLILSLFYILFFIITFRKKLNPTISFFICFLLLFICVLLFYQIDFVHEKIDISIITNEKLNYDFGNRFAPQISLYVWLQNLEQCFATLKISPIIGLGSGSIGFFKFDSFFFNVINYRFVTTLNLNDGYSLIFYLLIQYGLILVIPLIFFIILNSIKFIKNNFIENTSNRTSIAQKFFFVFSLTCLIGALIKEPNLSRSTLIFSFLIYSLVTNEN